MRVILFISLIYLSVSLPIWLTLFAALLYILLYTPEYELLILGVMLDAVFMPEIHFIPLYTMYFLLITIAGEYIRPLVSWSE